MPTAWSLEEVEATVADYFSMLDMELRCEPYNKAEHNRALQQFLDHRSHGAIERKHQNISGILIELGYPYIEGYKPLRNYQDLLRLVVEERLVGARQLSDTVEKSVVRQAGSIPEVPDMLAIQVDPPHVEDESVRVREIPPPSNYSVQRNYLELEARNRSLGRAGEEFIVLFEHERLARAGQRNLAKEIRHVALSEGDFLGYDILSFETDGRERLIEVKTTRFGAMTPFFASRNEVSISRSRHSEYQLYRLFNFRAQPKLYTLAGSLLDSCRLDAVTYSALPR